MLSINNIDISKKSDKYHKEECRIISDYLTNMSKGNYQDASNGYLALASKDSEDANESNRLKEEAENLIEEFLKLISNL